MAERTKSRGRGFTLIELLVAITILAVVAVLGWRGLDAIVRARVGLTADLEQTRGLQLAFAQLQSDCAAIADSGNIGNRLALSAEDNRLTLVRNVYGENLPTRVQVVDYRVIGGVLQRRESPATRDLGELDNFWQAAAAGGEQMQSVALQAGVGAMSMRTWLNGSTGWATPGALVTGAPAAAPLGPISGVATGALQSGQQGAALAAGLGSQLSYKGLEVSLQLRNSENKMIKLFLLGPV